jgi:hypothetical protein
MDASGVPVETVKLDISEALIIFALTGLPICAGGGAPHVKDLFDPIVVKHDISFFSFLFSKLPHRT